MTYAYCLTSLESVCVCEKTHNTQYTIYSQFPFIVFAQVLVVRLSPNGLLGGCWKQQLNSESLKYQSGHVESFMYGIGCKENTVLNNNNACD